MTSSAVLIKENRLSFKPVSGIRDISMCLLMLWFVNPYQRFMGTWLIPGVLMLTWIVFAYFAFPKAINRMIFTKHFQISILWPIFLVVLSLFGWAEFSLYPFLMPFYLSAFCYYAYGKNYKSIKFFITIYLLYIVAIGSNSLIKMEDNWEIARILANSDQTVTSAYASPLMADFSHIYAMLFIVLTGAYYIKYYQKTFLKVAISVFVIVLNVLLILRSQYTYAIILMLVFATCIYFFNFNNTGFTLKKVITPFVLILALVLFWIYGAEILYWIGNNINATSVTTRINSIAHTIENGSIQSGSDLQKRIMLYDRSVQTFLSNFVIGVGGKVYKAGGLVGGHSQIIDNYAYYGVFGGTFFIVYLISIYKNVRAYLVQNNYKFFRLLFWLYLINCLINTSYTEPILSAVYFIIPMFLFILQRKQY
jgi:hypothetical protein